MDSSDDEVYWGPITLKEIKKILSLKPKRENIQRRETIGICERPIMTEEESLNYSAYVSASQSNDGTVASEYVTAIENLNTTTQDSFTQGIPSTSELVEIILVSSDDETNNEVFEISDDELETELIEIKATKKPYSITENNSETQDDPLANASSKELTNNTNQNQSYELTLVSQQSKIYNGTHNALLDEGENLSPIFNASLTLSQSYEEHADVRNSSQDDVKDLSTNDSFDDTLKEMEMALLYGPDYKMSKNASLLSVAQVQDGPHDSNRKLMAKKTAVLKAKASKYDYLISPVGAYIKNKSLSPQFKIPERPIRLPSPATKLHVKSTTNFKNVVSPVAHYIKNTPKSALKTRVHVKHMQGPLPSMNLFSTANANKENRDDSLPLCSYKPAKCKMLNSEKSVKLPKNIQKLDMPNIQIIKHEGRVNTKTTINIEDKLDFSDISDASINCSVMNASSVQDVSVLISKPAYIN